MASAKPPKKSPSPNRTPRMAADGTTVAQRDPLVGILDHIRSQQVEEGFFPGKAAHITPQFMDSLQILAGGAATRLRRERVPTDLGTFFSTDYPQYGAKAGELQLDPMSWQAAGRAVLSHETGHLMDWLDPKVYRQFKALEDHDLARKIPENAYTGGSHEWMADAWGRAVRKVLPEIGDSTGSDSYPFSKIMISPRQQALMDSIVQAHLPMLKPNPLVK